jgi:hypothetical protein
MHPTITVNGADGLDIGDEVLIARDALLEIQLPRRSSRTWRYIAAGTRGRLIARHDGIDRVVLLDGPEARKLTLVGETMITRAPQRTEHTSRS